jgi:hypothetical protein
MSIGLKSIPTEPDNGARSDGFCYCGMCGYNAKLPAKHRAEVENQKACPWCEEVNYFSILGVCDSMEELEDNVTPDEPMMTWPETDPSKA